MTRRYEYYVNRKGRRVFHGMHVVVDYPYGFNAVRHVRIYAHGKIKEEYLVTVHH